MRNAFYILVAVAIGFLIGYFCQPKAIQETTITRVDTVRVEVPKPVEIEKVRTEYVYVPAPADTVVVEVADTVVEEVVPVDSVLVAVEVERRVYSDSLYRAVVSGAVVGDIHPTLEDINIYAKHTTTTIAVKPPLFAPFVSGAVGKGMVGLGGGVSIRAKHDIGAKVWQVEGKTKLTFEYSYKF